MKMRHLTKLILLLPGLLVLQAVAQTGNPPASGADGLLVSPPADRSVLFNLSDSGEYKPIIWGLDLAWLDEGNVRRGAAFMGKNNVDVIRSSFKPTNPLSNGNLQGEALTDTKTRIDIIKRRLNQDTKVVLNSDHPSIDPMFSTTNPDNDKNWAELIDITTRMHQEAGFDVVSVSPFNEPDFWQTGQGDMQDFYDIAVQLKKNPRFDSIRISGGNTLNCDFALQWYNFLQNQLDEGNTHQLAGIFDNYASFYEAVRAKGDHATNDELHNVMEAMVGVEYGLQTGIWWGTAEYTRGEFCKASDGRRLGYTEHRNNWAAASVYRAPDGKVRAFMGASERQGVTTSFRFVSKDRDVYFDGHGPQREYAFELPTGDPNTYQTALHTNGERLINITWGDDIQPVIDGRYVLVNRNSGKVLEPANGLSGNGTNIQQNAYNGNSYQWWNVNPISPRNGGDFSYFTIAGVANGKQLDVSNFSLDNAGNVILWEKGNWWDRRHSLNQVWYLEYAEDGWFYIRNQLSSLCLEVANNATNNGANIQQYALDSGYNQQWRLVPVGAPVEFEAPAAPANLVATAHAESVRLDWEPNAESDLAGYTIFRAESENGPYNTIARTVKGNAFVDNTPTNTGQYFYKLKAVDKSLNSSAFSETVSTFTSGDPALVAHLAFEGNFQDSSLNLNHGAGSGTVTFSEGKVDSQAIVFNGVDAFVQLPSTLANQQEITVFSWVYWNGGSPLQRIFDFGNDENQYINLTPRMRLAIKNEGSEQRLNAPSIPQGEWVQVAVTLGASVARLYMNGKVVDESQAVTIRPNDFKPILNYIGRGQLNAPHFNGRIDDFRLYNYALSPEEIAGLYKEVQTGVAIREERGESRLLVFPVPAGEVLRYKYDGAFGQNHAELELFNVYGNLVLRRENVSTGEREIDVSALPSGVYMLKIGNAAQVIAKKIVIQH